MAEVETAYVIKDLSTSDENNYEKPGEEFEEGEIESEPENNQSTDEVPAVHLLEHAWTFWFDNQPVKVKEEEWGSSIHPVHTFSTVEDFWGLYNNIHHPSKLGARADFYCFKGNIKPKWEDPVYASGGKWTINCSRGAKVDTFWLYTLLALIGEQFDYGDEICGAVVNVRARQERISIWTRNAQNEAAQVSIGKQWKDFLDCNDSIGFVFHEDAARMDKSAKNRYTV